MSGYVGSEEQRALQKRAEEGYAWVMSTPGACNVARAIGSDDPDRLGLDTIQDMLLKDGLFGFRLLTFPRLEQLRTELAAIQARIDTWDVYDGAAGNLGEAVATILEAGLPEGFSDMPALDGVGGTRTRLFQEFLFSAGIAPFSAGYLNGQYGKACNVGLLDQDGNLAACAHSYLPHNGFSPYNRWAWGGLVAVSPHHRGKGLGKLINALMIKATLDELAATHVYELVSASNSVSRKMVEACGLTKSESLICGLATRSADRFTR